MAAARGLRDLVKKISPPWLQTGNGEKLMYALAATVDLCVEKVTQGVKARFPKLAAVSAPGALQYIGDDRRIVRGLNESDVSYGARLARAFDAWHHAGSMRGVLQQVREWLPVNVRGLTVSNRSIWDVQAVGSDPTLAPLHLNNSTYAGGTPNWNWDDFDTLDPAYPQKRWIRFWLVVDSTDGVTSWLTSTKKSGGGLKCGDLTVSCGSDLPSSVGRTLKAIVATWKGGHAPCEAIIVSLDPANFEPTVLLGDPSLPDGTWGSWAKTITDTDGIKKTRPARLSTARYFSGPR